MKKLLLIAAALTATTASAAGLASPATASIDINATVADACQITGTTSAASMNYNAVDGASAVQPGVATFLCNTGALASASPVSGALSLNDVNGSSASLSASYTTTFVKTSTTGGDTWTYTLTPDAAAGQWSVPRGDYSNTVTINVSF